MRIEDTLCLLIPLKGRNKETKRILTYLNKTKSPFKILVADGGKEDISSQINTSIFPNIDIEYFYNGFDVNIPKFMNKMNNAFAKIEHPFTIMVDNDDFISTNGMIQGIKFLSENSDYSSYRSSVTSFLNNSDIYKDETFYSNCAIERLKDSISKRGAGWHNITRTHIYKTLFSILDECQVDDLQMVFSIVSFWCSIYGNYKKLNSGDYYYHIQGNSLVQNKGIYSRYIHWLRDPKFEKSFSILISAVSNAIQHISKKQPKDFLDDYVSFHLSDVCRSNKSSSPFTANHLTSLSKKYDDVCKKNIEQYSDSVSFHIDDTNSEYITPAEEKKIIKKLL
jgi:glycosyltransferase domain-containing protein